MSEDVQSQNFRESAKLSFEARKHLTTLSAGSVVLIATFLKDIFPKGADGVLLIGPGLKLLIAGSFIFFGLTILTSTYGMQRFTSRLRVGPSGWVEQDYRPKRDYLWD